MLASGALPDARYFAFWWNIDYSLKERKSPSLSDQASVYTLFPEGGVAWQLTYRRFISHVFSELYCFSPLYLFAPNFPN